MQAKRLEVGNYILGQTLGEGTTGKVKLATHKDTEKQFAIKIINKSQFDVKPDLQRKIHREIALMRLLDHPHILKLEEVCESPRHLYIVLEFAKHGELFDYLVSRRRLAPEAGIEFFRQLIYGLDYLHGHAICHRDLKPENILLNEFDQVKIADFGFARWLRSSMAETSCGSLHYAAPEVVRGLHYDGRAADIWSCGVILYALLAGRLPFDDPSVRNLLAKVKTGRYTMPNLPFEIQDLISRMLTVDCHERITIEQIKAHPAFHIGLPKIYVVPTPLPLPFIESPIDPSTVSSTLYHVLESIGYSSEADVKEELAKPGQQMAKVFYAMFSRLVSLHALPWPDSGMTTPELPDDAYLMSPKPMALIANDGIFERKKKAFDPSTPTEVRSLASSEFGGWNKMSMGGTEAEEQPVYGLQVGMAELIGKVQSYLITNGFDCFFPSDMQILARKADLGLYLIFNVVSQTRELLNASIIKAEGSTADFTLFVEDLRPIFAEMMQEDVQDQIN